MLCALAILLAADFAVEVTPVGQDPVIVEGATLSPEGVSVPEGGPLNAGVLPWADVQTVRPTAAAGGGVSPRLINVIADGRPASDKATLKLRKGYHRLHVGYVRPFGAEGEPTLKLEIKGPPFPSWQKVPGSLLYRPRDEAPWTDDNQPAALDDEGFRPADTPASVKRGLTRRVLTAGAGGVSLASMKVVSTKSLSTVSVPTKPDDGVSEERPGLLIEGLLRIPRDGEYSLRLTTDGAGLLAFGRPPSDMTPQTDGGEDNMWVADLGYGGRLVGEEPTFLDGEFTLTIPMAGVGAGPGGLTVPAGRPLMRELWRAGAKASVEAGDQPADSDTLYAAGKSGDVRAVSGTLKAIDEDALTFTLGGTDRSVPLDRVRGVVFAKTEEPADETEGGPLLLVRLHGPTVIPGRVAPVADDDPDFLTVDPPGTLGAVGLPAEAVASITVRTGDRLSLATVTPVIEATPLLDLSPTVSVNRSPAGRPLRVDGNALPAGFAVGSQTALTFEVPPSLSRLATRVGLQDREGEGGLVDVRVLADGDVLFERLALTSEDGLVPVDVDLAGRDRVTLFVGFGDDSDAGDVVVWAEPTLLGD